MKAKAPKRKIWKGAADRAQFIVGALMAHCIKVGYPRIYRVEPLTLSQIGTRGWYGFRVERLDWSRLAADTEEGQWKSQGFQSVDDLADALAETDMPLDEWGKWAYGTRT